MPSPSVPLVKYEWSDGQSQHRLTLVRVAGTGGQPYSFGEGVEACLVEVPDFLIGTAPVTQALWDHVLGAASNPAINRGPTLPVENVSWDQLAEEGGFFDRINDSPIREAIAAQTGLRHGRFRLPAETEWEYAARGGPHWRDGFRFSGGDDIDAVAWYNRRDGHTHPVGEKAPNQLGLYDMSGNVWEWCHDVFTPNVADIPRDGTPHAGPGAERVLRGGCFHNWAIHCTVSKRYEIGSEIHDGCIGFRLVFAP